ncbi:MAG: DVU_1555 family C-GCAxxG-C-C protein [Oscillospiraceae bacterium]
MDDALTARVLQLTDQKYHCSQAMLALSMEQRGISDPFLLRCLGGLGRGMGGRSTCGTLTGGACLISSFAPQLASDDTGTGSAYYPAVEELLAWFEGQYGSTQCRDIAPRDTDTRRTFCARLVADTYRQCLHILSGYGVDTSRP